MERSVLTVRGLKMIDFLFMLAIKLWALLMSIMIFYFIGYFIWAVYYETKMSYLKWLNNKLYLLYLKNKHSG